MSALAEPGTDPIGTSSAFDEFDPGIESAEAMGIDSGATLVKLCVRREDGTLHLATWPSPSRERLIELVERLGPARLGVTGCGAPDVLPGLPGRATAPIEFEAWGRGANEMLERLGQASQAPYLLVAIGTGTSALRVEGDRVERMGGTALGGGAALGLGMALTGARTPEDVNALAMRGARQNVDLMVTDLFEDAKDVGAVIASSFGKLARHGHAEDAEPPSHEDLAAAALGIVSDNIGLLATAYARAARVSRIVYGGSTLVAHPQFADVARGFGLVMGHETIVLPHGGHTGAIGAMLLGEG